MTNEIKNEKEINKCGYDIAWGGKCNNDKPCSSHQNEKCWKCGKPATHDCSVSSSMVCGRPGCDEHPHNVTHYK